MIRNGFRLAQASVFCFICAMIVAGCAGQNEQSSASDPTGAAFLEPTPTLQQLIAVTAANTALPDPATEMPEGQALDPEELAPEPSPTIVATIPPTPTMPAVSINGMSVDQFIIMPAETRENIRQIFNRGVSLGRDRQVFSILGDSLIATNQSLAKWDSDDYNLGEYDFLQPTIDQYAGSFGRYGPTVRVGLHSWSVFDPTWADKELCLANEDVLACEIRLSNPSVMIVFLGSNDAGTPGGFNVNYRQVVETLIDQGIVPILATKADRFEGGDNVNNNIIRKIAADYQVPLLEFDLLADTLPGRGLSPDNIHLTYLEPLDYSSQEIFTLGYPVHNLASLLTLDAVRREIGGSVEN